MFFNFHMVCTLAMFSIFVIMKFPYIDALRLKQSRGSLWKLEKNKEKCNWLNFFYKFVFFFFLNGLFWQPNWSPFIFLWAFTNFNFHFLHLFSNFVDNFFHFNVLESWFDIWVLIGTVLILEIHVHWLCMGFWDCCIEELNYVLLWRCRGRKPWSTSSPIYCTT